MTVQSQIPNYPVYEIYSLSLDNMCNLPQDPSRKLKEPEIA
jgi:hypothetical protein